MSSFDPTAMPNGQLATTEGLPRAWDVIVIGAGPSGSVAACRLSTLGYRVLLLDKARFPREKTCGDALIPDALKVLDRLGLLNRIKAAGHTVGVASIFSPSQIEVAVPGEYVTLKRSKLDSLIAHKAVEQGATFCQAAVENITVAAGGSVTLTLRGSAAALSARIVVVATGGDTRLLSKVGMLKRSEPSALALRCYVTSEMQVDRLVISYDRSITPGYAWVFPLGGGEYNIGCGVFYRKARHHKINLRDMFDRFVAEFPLARDLMRQRSAITKLQGAPLRCNLTGTKVLGMGSVAAIGEAIGATFPLTGEGIGKAMETAEIAAETVHECLRSGSLRPLRRLPFRVRTELLPRYLGYEIGERWLSYPWLNDLIAWRVSKSRFLQKVISGIINETVDPKKLFSVRNLVKSLWR
jgi:geranylgeranyl reductase family protein